MSDSQLEAFNSRLRQLGYTLTDEQAASLYRELKETGGQESIMIDDLGFDVGPSSIINDNTDSRVSIPSKEKPQQKKHNIVIDALLGHGQNHIAAQLGFRAYPTIEENLSADTIASVGIFTRTVFLACFVAIFIQSFTNSYKKMKFVSLMENAGVCNHVARSWTIDGLLADFNGNWQGSPSFNPVEAMYIFNLFDFEVLKPEYITFMEDMKLSLSNIGTITAKQNLAENILWWNSWFHVQSLPAPSGNGSVVQSITMTGDSQYILAKDSYQGTIASVDIDCDISLSTVDFNRAVGAYYVTFSYSKYMTSNCSTIFDPSIMGYSPSLSGDVWTMKIGVKALMASLAVSYQVNGPDSMKVFSTIKEISRGVFNGVTYSVLAKFDSNFPTMLPMYCIGPVGAPDSQWNCLLRMSSNAYGIPFLAHAGPNFTYPTTCDCSLSTGLSPLCDIFNFTFGVVVFNWKKNITVASRYPKSFRPFIPALEFFYVDPVQTGKHANIYSYKAAWAAIFGQGISTFQDSNWRENAYEFAASVSFGYGSLVVLSTGSSWDQGVSENKYQLTDGACNDAIVTPNYHALIETPWGSLLELYYQCTQTLMQALISAAGVASSSAGIVAGLALTIALQAALSSAQKKKAIKTVPEQ